MSEFDLVFRRGTVVDGTGSEPRAADVAITDGLIVAVGHIGGKGRREVDVDGALVAPGFTDIHTHFDGQATWDQRLQPSSWHGVTTVVMGNCGVGFAPVRPQDRDRLVDLMEGVEDIPGVALKEGIPWEWETFPEYLDFLGQREYDIDVGAQVPHAAIRLSAMGDRASAYEQATADEITMMANLVGEAVEAGAIGFSTSRTLNHKSSSGELTLGYDAGAEELVAIAQAIGRTGKGVLQLITDFRPDLDTEFRILRDMVRASGRPLTFSLAERTVDKPRWHTEVLERILQANRDGLSIRGQVPARGIGLLLGLKCTLHPFIANPIWQRIAALPPDEQAVRMSEPSFREEVLVTQTGTPNVTGGQFITHYDRMFEVTDPINYEPPLDSSLAARAERTGRTPEELAYDCLTSAEGSGMLYVFLHGYGPASFDAAHDLLAHDYTLPGLSDGGAHLGIISDGSFPTTLLDHWVRARDGKHLDLSFVVKRQARDTARAVGLHDRGELRPGQRADINIIDMKELRLHQPEMHYDLPAGGKRLLQRADGYKHTFVRGIETYRDGEPTGDLPGRLIRSRTV